MFPAANPTGAVAKIPQPVTGQTAARTAAPQAPETARTSAGETAAADVRAETAQAVKAAEQSAVAARLRDGERTEDTERQKDVPTGPPPAFEESYLERLARVALEPPDEAAEPEEDRPAAEEGKEERAETSREAPPPPSPTDRAEVSFAETQAFTQPKEPATVDVAR